MTIPANKSRAFYELRRKLEILLQSLPRQKPELQDAKILRLVHELEVYQMQLEVQNEELRSTQRQLQSARDRCVDLYEPAPVGCLTIDNKGLISQVNIAAATMLGIPRACLIKRSLSSLISPEYHSVYFKAREKALETNDRQICLLEFVLTHDRRLSVQMKLTAGRDDSGHLCQWRIAVMDITQRKCAEESLRKAHGVLEEQVKKRTRELVATIEELKESDDTRRQLSSMILTAHEMERKRIAQELHDGVAQCLSAVKFKIEYAVAKMATGCADEAEESCKGIIPIIQQSIDELRGISINLRPPMLDELGILATLQWFSREFQKTCPSLRLETIFDLIESQVPEALNIVIYRVIQESLHNVAKHSQADRVVICLTQKKNVLNLAIRDNGQGFDPLAKLASDATASGYGFNTMKERVELAGGIFTIQSANGEGTTVMASWTLPPE